nr:pyridoxal phosphate phosphatase PHOSPHO2-like isoform X1 [Leptinotarsa decemlineata]
MCNSSKMMNNLFKLAVMIQQFLSIPQKMSKNLAVFDFDHTIIHENSDVAVMNLIDPKKIPKEIKLLHRSDGWTAFMQGVFETLHKHKIKEENIRKLVETLQEVKGMRELIKELHENLNYDVIIISDSNSYFINTWLDANDMKKYITGVFTNPAHFENDLLKISMYHLQESCKLSTRNLCKGQIMEEFLKEQQERGLPYERVLYCGDGLNDFCPILRLGEGDLACVRAEYKCAEIVAKAKDGSYKDEEGKSRDVKSDVFVWNDGYEIINYIKQNEV